MCGIAGRIGSVGVVGAPDLTHRGPDRTGRFANDVVVLDAWRLRVVDLSPAADQPMQSEDGAGVLVYNGEVYNAPALRQALISAGETFRTSSDTEVILKLLVREGAAAVERLRGMFAFAFWDLKRRRLLLARDAFGIKPLFYSRVGGLQFASELPALLSMVPGRPEPDMAALWSFFTFGFVPSPCTAFKGVFKLRPGEVIEFDQQGSETSRRTLPPPWLAKTGANRDVPLSIREAVVAAVSEQFQADVPVGVFLSGGMDSNVILAAAREGGIGDIRTFTVDFKDHLEGASFDETSAARSSARFFGTHHTEVPVSLGEPEELLEDLDRFGEPFLNPTVYLTRLLSREARRHVTVALSGAGGDELFGGYPRYAALRFSSLLSGPIGRFASGAARLAIRVLRKRAPRAIRRAAWIGEAAFEGNERAFLNWTYYLDEPEKARLVPLLAALGHDSLADLAPGFESGAQLGGMLLAGPVSDLSLFLPENILAYTDIGSMAESLEVRVPLLDPDIAYLSLRALRPRDVGLRQQKRLLRDAFADSLPPHVLRAKKRGFNPPLANWIRGPLDRLFDSEATAEFRRDFVSADELNRMRAAHKSGIEDYSHELLAVLVAARWYKQWR